MVTFPETVIPLEIVRVETFVPVPSVSERQTEVELLLGWFAPVKLASPMMASRLAVGTPAVQLAKVPQVVLDVPFHEVCAIAIGAASIIPISNHFR